MSKNILYYPTIEFKSEDYRWLWVSSLLWDRIYRIVPDGYKLNEPRNIQELCSTDEIGIPLSPNKYSKRASDEFLLKLESREWQAAALEFDHEDIELYNQYCRVHKDKIDVTLRNVLLLDKDISQDEDWLYVPREMSNLYMAYLAKYIADENKLALNTHDTDFWTASTFFSYDTQIQSGYFPGEEYIDRSYAVLASLLIKDIIPENIMNITPKELIKFRQQRKDERTQFIQAIDSFRENLSGISDERILRDIISEEKAKVEYALNNYKKSMDIIKATRWTGHLTSLLTIAADALGYIKVDTNTISAITSGSVGLGFITGLVEKNVSVKETPYSYLTSLKKILPDKFDNYHYNLYRQVEEFIND